MFFLLVNGNYWDRRFVRLILYFIVFSNFFLLFFFFKIDINCLCGTVLGSKHVNLILHKRKIEYEFHYIVFNGYFIVSTFHNRLIV